MKKERKVIAKRVLMVLMAIMMVITYMPMSDLIVEGKAFAETNGFLSSLAFGSTNKVDSKGEYLLSPSFQSNILDYELVVPDNTASIYVWASLSELGTGKTIKANYEKTTGADSNVTVTSGKTTGVALTSCISSGKFNGNTVKITVGDQTYNVVIKRSATLSSFNIVDADGNNIPFNPAFSGSKTEYTAAILCEENITFSSTPKIDTASISGNGSLNVTEETWGGISTIDYTITVSSEDAVSTTYTMHFKKYGLEGKGTKENPFRINNIDEFIQFRDLVNSGVSFLGKYVELTSDVILPSNWVPIGDLTASTKAKYVDYANTYVSGSTPFMGTFDGDGHTITVPSGELTAFGSVSCATLKNFNIYGEKIPGYGVVQYWLRGQSGGMSTDGHSVIIENVKLLSGTHTMMSGFIGGYAGGSDRITIRNCEVESGAVIGNDGKGFWTGYEETESLPNTAYQYGPTAPIYQNDFVGSFVGAGSGEIINCKSSATVLGNNYVGGIWGMKGQSMGDCNIRECYFDGEVKANGTYAGGILGSGYTSTSAPNTPCATIQNCACYGKVSATDYVGGITGGEITVGNAWNNGIGYIQNNYFGGQITCDGDKKAAIIGYFNCLDNCNVISNNYYLSTCGVNKGVNINLVETQNEKYKIANINAGDDPESFSKAVNVINEELIESLNSGANSSTTWKLHDGKAVCGDSKHIVSITSEVLNSQVPKEITDFDQFDDTDITITYSDGTKSTIKVSDCEKVDWSFPEAGYRAVQIRYNMAQCVFVLKNTQAIESKASEHIDKDFDGKCDNCNYKLGTVKTVSVDYTSQYGHAFLHAPKSKTKINSNLAELYGYTDGIDYLDGVSVLDVLVQAHIDKYGSLFTKETANNYLTISYGSPTKQFGISNTTAYGGFFLNNSYANDGTESQYGGYNGTTVATQAVTDTDLVEFFFYEDENYGDTYNWFSDKDGYRRSFNVGADNELELSLKGFGAMSAYTFKNASEMIASQNAYAIKDAQIYCVNSETGALTAISGAVTDENGNVTLSFENEGTYTIAAYGTDDCTYKQILSLTNISVGTHVHNLVKINAHDENCTENGNSAYWYCNNCKKYYSDSEGNNEIVKDSWIIQATGHTLKKTIAHESSCLLSGNSEYWTCSECGKYFSDANGNTEIQKNSWVVSALGHKDANSDGKCDLCGTDLTNNNITVYITIMGDTIHGEGSTVHTLKNAGLTTWVSRKAITVVKNSSVWTVMQQLTSDLGGMIIFNNPTGNYFSDVTYNGVTLGEFDNGKNSGWMYTLNGTHPNLGVSEQIVADGDEIVIHYTDDYTKEEGSEKWNTESKEEAAVTKGAGGVVTAAAPAEVKVTGDTAKVTVDSKVASDLVKKAAENKATEIKLEVTSKDTGSAKTINAELPTSTIKDIVNKTDASLVLDTPSGDLNLNKDVLKEVASKAGSSNVNIEIKSASPTEAQAGIVGKSAQVIELSITAGTTKISDFNGGVATFKTDVPAALKDKDLVAVYLDAENKLEEMTTRTSADKKTVEFDTMHFSTFALVDREEAGLTVVDPVETVKNILLNVSVKTKLTTTAKKSQKITVSLDKSSKEALNEIKALGYTVKYKFLRSTKKNSGYKLTATKKSNTYTYTKGTKGKKYYYKTKLAIYDKEGKLVTTTNLKVSNAASKKWTK